MLYDVIRPDRHETSSFVLETERLMLRAPAAADAKAIAHLANDRRIAENTRRLPHPYDRSHAEQFLASLAQHDHDRVFLIESDRAPIGMVGLDFTKPDTPELGYWLGVPHWGKGFATEAARAIIDYAFEEFRVEQLCSGARVTNPASRHILEKCGFQWTGIELHRFVALGSSTPVDSFRLQRGVWSSLKSWSNSTRRVAS
jgi:RimJ/RimL family protein N-acetyltransferase